MSVIVTAPLPVVIVTSSFTSILVRSLTFSTAFFEVGEHTPPLQFMFCVAAAEISTEASQAGAMIHKVSASHAVRILICDLLVRQHVRGLPYRRSNIRTT